MEVDRIQNELSGKWIEWIFNCPSNPIENRVLERLVQCVKKVLRQTMKEDAPKKCVLESLIHDLSHTCL